MSTGSFFKTYLEVKKFNFKEQFFIVRNYYKNLRFCLVDLLLLFVYFFINPYRVSKKFLKKKNYQNVHLYGETPLSSFENIIKHCDVQPTDSFLELGSGRGRCALWLSSFVGCSIDAIEWISLFQKIAYTIARIAGLKKIKFYSEDMFGVDLKNPDIVFLYGTCLEDDEIYNLIDKFKNMKKGVKIITISYPLSIYDPSFCTSKSFPVKFPWGKTFCYINLKK